MKHPLLTDIDPVWYAAQSEDDRRLIWRCLTEAGRQALVRAGVTPPSED